MRRPRPSRTGWMRASPRSSLPNLRRTTSASSAFARITTSTPRCWIRSRTSRARKASSPSAWNASKKSLQLALLRRAWQKRAAIRLKAPSVARRKKGQPVHGWVIVDKPQGVTSTQVVGAVRRIFDAQKAGHAGTLDPMATGVLAVALGEATKTVPFAMDADKTYRFTAHWGEAHDTNDTEGRVTAISAVRPSREAIEAMLPRFTGSQTQTPPAYSAIKVQGERAYDLAREGEAVELTPRTVEVYESRLVEIPAPDLVVFVFFCGNGSFVCVWV